MFLWWVVLIRFWDVINKVTNTAVDCGTDKAHDFYSVVKSKIFSII